jgi:hypothetical protein
MMPVGWQFTGRWIGTAGLITALAGFIQLDVSGFFDALIENYLDSGIHPGGPPSRITREIIDNPDAPLRTGARNWLFFHPKTGFWLVIAGTTLQVLAVWS